MYQEHKPCALLRPYVVCYWTRVSRSGRPEHRILPDGCLDIVFELASPRPGRLVGAMTRAHLFPGGGPERWLGVRFRPGGAAPFFSFPLTELTDRSLDLSELWPEAGRLTERLLATSGRAEAVFALEEELLRRLAWASPLERRVMAAVGALEEDPSLRVSALAERVGVTRQHLGRLFSARVGLSPKQFARVVRLRRVLDQLPRGGDISWADLALAAGYYDQAHLALECRALTGLSPTALRGSILPRQQDSSGAESRARTHEGPSPRRGEDR